MSKYTPARLPLNRDEAKSWASEREAWAKEAREKDKHGSAKEYELVALLLRDKAEQLP